MPIVTQIREHVRQIEEEANAGHMITSAKTLEATHRLENGQTEIRHGIQVLSQGGREILQEQLKFGQRQENDSAALQAIRDLMERALPPGNIIKDQPPVVHSNGQQPITVVQEKAIGN